MLGFWLSILFLLGIIVLFVVSMGKVLALAAIMVSIALFALVLLVTLLSNHGEKDNDDVT